MSNHRPAQAIGRQGQGQTQAGIKVRHICGTPNHRNWVTFRGCARTDWPLECKSTGQMLLLLVGLYASCIYRIPVHSLVERFQFLQHFATRSCQCDGAIHLD